MMELPRGVVPTRTLVPLFAASLLLSAQAFAQQEPDEIEESRNTRLAQAGGSSNREEITVTARKKEEKLQDVPISISAFTAKGLRDRNIQNAYDLANFTPNFQLTPNLGRRLDVPNIRGQFGPLIGGTAPNASFFVDGVYVTGSIGSTSIANLERIEVLRGPQSAQFGRATFAGAVNYITRRPTDVFESEVRGRLGEDGQEEAGLWLSGPIIKDQLYFFAGYSHEKWDGEWRNGLEPYDVVAGFSAGGYPSIGITEPYGQNVFFGSNWDQNPQGPNDPPCLSGYSASTRPGALPITSFPGEGSASGCAPTAGDNTPIGGTQTNIATVKFVWEPTDDMEFTAKYERALANDDHFVYFFVPPAENNNCFNRAGGGSPGLVPGAGDAIDPRAGSRSGGWYCGELSDIGFVPKLNLPNFSRGVTAATPGSPGVVTSPPAPFIGLEERIDRYLVAFKAGSEYELNVRYAVNDGTSEYVRDLDRSYSLGPVVTGLFEAYSRNDDYDQSFELRLSSPVDGWFRWQAGLYWYDYEQQQSQRNFNGFGDSFLIGSSGSQGITNEAVFGSVEFDITKDLTFAFEGRYAKDEANRTTAPLDAGGTDPITDPPLDLSDLPPGCLTPGVDMGTNTTLITCSENFYSFSPRATLTWNALPDDSLTFYWQIAEGNKPGGFNFAYFDADVDFSRIVGTEAERTIIEEEEATTYETGVKGIFFDNTLEANLSVFYIDWENQAVNVLACIPSSDVGLDCQNNNIIDNAGESEVKGLELEMKWFPTQSQTYTLAYGFTDSTVEEFLDDEFAVLRCPEECYETLPMSEELTPDARALRNSLANVAGNKAPRVPRHNLAVSQLFQAPIAGAVEWFFRNDVIYESKRYSTVSNLTWAPSAITWNGRVGLQAERWTISFYVDNITNEKSPVQIQDFPLFDSSQGYVGTGFEVNQNAFQLQPRRSRNAGVVGQIRFGG